MAINKKRNSLFLYEILIREMTKAVIAKETERKELILSIIKEAFHPGTQLYLEWRIYRSLLGFKTNKPLAQRIFDKVSSEHKTIDQKKLSIEQGALIKKINKNFKPSIFSHFLPNYKSMTTIYQLFHNKLLSPKKRAILEEQVINNLSSDEQEEKKENYQPISKLALKTFVQKFNDKYKVLLPEQRELLSKYALTDVKQIELKAYLNEEVGRLKRAVNGSLLLTEVKSDQEMVEKTREVILFLESFSNQEVTQDMVEKLLRVQQLAKEIEED